MRPPRAHVVLPGLKVREALRARSLWLIAAAQLLLSTAWIGVGAHVIPYLIGIGWTPTVAAEIVSIAFVFSTAGNFFVGALADRLNGRTALGLVCFAAAAGIAALFYAAHGVALLVYLLLFGTVGGTRAVLIPLVVVDSLGIKQLGTLLGIEGGRCARGSRGPWPIRCRGLGRCSDRRGSRWSPQSQTGRD